MHDNLLLEARQYRYSVWTQRKTNSENKIIRCCNFACFVCTVLVTILVGALYACKVW